MERGEATRPLRILFIQESSWTRSLPLTSHHLAELLSCNGHHVTILDRDMMPPSFLKPVAVVADYSRLYPGARIELITSASVGLPLLSTFSGAISQVAVLTRAIQSADIAILDSVITSGPLVVRICEAARVPVVFQMFDRLSHLTRFRFANQLIRTFESDVYKRASKIVAVDEPLVEYAVSLGARRENCTCLPVLVDRERFSRARLEREDLRKQWHVEADKVILFTGRLFSFAGLDLIVQSFPDVLKSVPRAKLIIAGDGPLYPKLRSMVHVFGLKDRVSLLGRVPYDLIPILNAIADVCINPFRSDAVSDLAFPSKIGEYMAGGNPVIASDLVGTTRVLESAKGVILDRPERLSEHIVRLLADKDLRERMGRDAALSAAELFGVDVILPRFEEILRSVAYNV